MARGDWSHSSYCGVAGLTTKKDTAAVSAAGPRLPTRARYQCVVLGRDEPGSQELVNQGLVSQPGDIVHPQVSCPEPVSVSQAW